MYIFIPLRHNRPIPSLAMKLINDLHPEPNPAGLEKLPQGHSTTLVDIFDQANIALQSLSGIAELPDEQKFHDKVYAVAQELIAELDEANRQLGCLPDDRATETLRTLIEGISIRVQEELNGTSSEPGFASQISGFFAGEITDELALSCNARYLAIEWDIDPHAAAERLAETSAENAKGMGQNSP